MRSVVIALIFPIFASGCVGLDMIRDRNGGTPLTPSGPNFAVGSTLSSRMNASDRQALAAAFAPTMNSAQDAARAAWSSGNATGEVQAGASYVRNLAADPSMIYPAPAGLDLARPLETDLGPYVARNAVNVRVAPNGEAPVTVAFLGGEQFEALGRIVGGDWLLIAQGGGILGYVYEPLTRPAPGRDLMLAGGPIKTPEYCRDFTQTMAMGERNDLWTGRACRAPSGQWRIEIAPSG